jgi:hypothetical protein
VPGAPSSPFHVTARTIRNKSSGGTQVRESLASQLNPALTELILGACVEMSRNWFRARTREAVLAPLDDPRVAIMAAIPTPGPAFSGIVSVAAALPEMTPLWPIWSRFSSPGARPTLSAPGKLRRGRYWRSKSLMTSAGLLQPGGASSLGRRTVIAIGDTGKIPLRTTHTVDWDPHRRGLH